MIFYPQTQNDKYIELGQFETEIILSKGKSCDFQSNKNPTIKIVLITIFFRLLLSSYFIFVLKIISNLELSHIVNIPILW